MISQRSFPKYSPGKRDQKGVVLIVCLVMMVLMTIVGMAGIRVISTQERMVGQAFDRTLSFQAAESALREIELRIETTGRPEPAPSTPCSMMGTPYPIMVCGQITTTVPRWQSSTFTDWAAASPNGTGNFTITPDYFVEYLGATFPCAIDSAVSDTCMRYRITARASPSSERATVMLQSIYATFRPN